MKATGIVLIAIGALLLLPVAIFGVWKFGVHTVGVSVAAEELLTFASVAGVAAVTVGTLLIGRRRR